MPTLQPDSYRALLEKYAQVLWDGEYGQMYGPSATPGGTDKTLWQRVQGAMPDRLDVLKGIGAVQEAGQTAKLLWQLANYTPQYQVTIRGQDRVPVEGGYYY